MRAKQTGCDRVEQIFCQKVPTFPLTALEGPGEIAGISRLHPQVSVHIFTLPSFNAHACVHHSRHAGRCNLAHRPFSPLRRWEVCLHMEVFTLLISHRKVQC